MTLLCDGWKISTAHYCVKWLDKYRYRDYARVFKKAL